MIVGEKYGWGKEFGIGLDMFIGFSFGVVSTVAGRFWEFIYIIYIYI